LWRNARQWLTVLWGQKPTFGSFGSKVGDAHKRTTELAPIRRQP
jgi:hypothetical protein